MNTAVGIFILLLFFAILLAKGILANRVSSKTVEDYYVANRTLGPFILVMTSYASLVSAFLFIGVPGMVYNLGPGLIGAMTPGTIAAGLGFYLIGVRVWMLGKKYGYLTPVDLFRERFESRALAVIMFVVIVLFTLPFMALQPMGAGHFINALTGGAIPYYAGAAITTVILVVYVLLAGMRGVAWTDALQGSLLFIFLWITLFAIAGEAGGFAEGARRAAEATPNFFARQGPTGFWNPRAIWTWFFVFCFSSVMQPHIFARFYAARSTRTIKSLVTFWPLIIASTYIPAVLIGVYGKVVLPGLKQADQLVPKFVVEYLPAWLGALIFIGALSAMMSTVDSQFLALGSMVKRDFWEPLTGRKVDSRDELKISRWSIGIIAVIILILAYKPPAMIGMLGAATFAVVAVLMPVAVGALYWKRATAVGCIVSIFSGTAIIGGTYLNFIPRAVWGGWDPSGPGLLAAAVTMVVVSLITKAPGQATLDKFFKFVEPYYEEPAGAKAGRSIAK
ncbi:MAG: sodium:solute symporter family protein [Firmicutes bacterium]|nr:sodium:solute symporter family protein [Bacillota bacterium]